MRRSGADTGRCDHSLGESQRDPAGGAWGGDRPISQGSGAVSTGREEVGYKSSEGEDDRGDSSETDQGDDSGGDPSGDLETDQSEDVSEDLSEPRDLGGDPDSNDTLQPD